MLRKCSSPKAWDVSQLLAHLWIPRKLKHKCVSLVLPFPPFHWHSLRSLLCIIFFGQTPTECSTLYMRYMQPVYIKEIETNTDRQSAWSAYYYVCIRIYLLSVPSVWSVFVFFCMYIPPIPPDYCDHCDYFMNFIILPILPIFFSRFNAQIILA